jgi:hypothetical protein
VRDNQRRSRARHREYVDALRARLLRHEREGAQASAEVQRAARAVARENALLRALLDAKGVAAGEVEGWLREHQVGGKGEGRELGRVLAGMEARRVGGEDGAGEARVVFAEVPGQNGAASDAAVAVHLLAPHIEKQASGQARKRENGLEGQPQELPALPALGTNRYDAIRDCLGRQTALDTGTH